MAMMLSNSISGISAIKGFRIESETVTTDSISALKDVFFVKRSRSITPRIAPVEAMATSPKLSFSDALLSFFILEIPKERESINGTASIPVVAPEASKEMARNSLEVKIERPKIRTYKTISIL